MLRNLAWMTVGAAILAGCGSKPESPFPRLKVGDEALAYDQHERRVPLHGIPKGSGVAGMDLDFVSVGEKVRVINDVGPDIEGSIGKREVRVVPLEGELKGVTGRMYRKNLKPIGSR